MSDDHETLPDEPADQPTEALGSPSEDAREPAAVPNCTECGTPLEAGQIYCLECGAPTPSAPRLRRRIGSAGVLAMGLVVLGLGAGTLAYALARDDDAVEAGVPTTIPTVLPPIGTTATSDSPPVDVTDLTSTGLPSFPSVPGDTSTIPPSTGTTDPALTDTTTDPGLTGTATPIPSTPPSVPSTAGSTPSVPPTSTPTNTGTGTGTNPVDPPATSGADTWPDGVSGWTVILASTSSQSDATRFRDRVRSTGRAAGLIESSLYSSLEPDLWVVFVGQYSSRSQAIDQAASLRSTYPGAYAQRIEG